MCGQHKQDEYLRRICGMSAEMQTYRISGFAPSNPSRREARQLAEEVVANPRWWLTYWGSVGTGKSYLLAAIVNGVRERGLKAVYIIMADLLDHLRRAYHPLAGQLDFDGVWDKVTKADCLAIDEVDRVNMTEWAKEKLFQIINTRYINADHCLTVFATNRTVQKGLAILEDDAGYFESRLMDARNRIVHLRGGDVRPALERGNG